ncbi:acyltransferase family protein [Colwellia echini]|uniref:Acyltransferase n=1 Tax=Colwellia echini TaxID=1982103 RepID=A0ABY3MUA6_9GAMM|nr:acyltransferase [Colwellia echini]TYK64773.1 acyltransferase [Colwellia echini]
MNKRFEALDAFRGLCALCVVILHMRFVGTFTELNFFRGSGIFVEFFFVLSGFVLAHSYGFRKNLNFKSYMKARFFRIYPLHFTMFIFVFVFQLAKFLIYKYTSINFDGEPLAHQFAIGEILPNLMLIHAWTPYTELYSFNGPSWSISIEFYMYALLFVSIVAFKSNKVISWLVISMMAFLLMYFDSHILVGSVLRGLSAFFGGAVIYVVYCKISHLKVPYILGGFIEVLLILLIILIVQSDLEYRSILATILFIVTVLCFAFECGAVSKILKVNVFQYAGKLSYSIYLTHFVLLMYISGILKVLSKLTNTEMVLRINDSYFMNLGSVPVNTFFAILIILITIYISNITYKYIELKGQKLNRK